jgi:hypothetical protein
VSYVAQQVKVAAEEWAAYDWSGRAIKRHRMEIRGAFGFRECTEEDQGQLAEWLAVELCGPSPPDPALPARLPYRNQAPLRDCRCRRAVLHGRDSGSKRS